ncbi:MAG: hypothetical protein KGJ13_01445 [Patescibacteria group bacterium]|nr:hypothetical protein [Patescibacteria group bacterium]
MGTKEGDKVLRFALNGHELTVYVNTDPNEAEKCSICGAVPEGEQNEVLVFTYEIAEMDEDGVHLPLEGELFEAVKSKIDSTGFFGKAFCLDCYDEQDDRFHREIEND